MVPQHIKNAALGEISAHMAAIWCRVTGESDSNTDMKPAAIIWYEDMVTLLSPKTGEKTPDFSSIDDHIFIEGLIDSWMERWRKIRIIHAQIWGLSEKTATELIDHLYQVK